MIERVRVHDLGRVLSYAGYSTSVYVTFPVVVACTKAGTVI